MSVDFRKLNKAGLGASSFGTRKTTGTSAQVIKNLSSSSAATKSSLFSFRGSVRTGWTPGEHVSRNMNDYNYQGIRASLNGVGGGRRTYSPSYTVGGNYGNYTMPNVKVNNSYMTGMVVGQTISQGIGLLNQLGILGGNNNNVASPNQGNPLNQILNSNQNVNTNAVGFSGQMSAATSFTQLNELETSVNSKKETLDTDYKALDPKKDMDEIIKGSQEGFEVAGVDLNTSALTLSTLDKSDLEGCINTIDDDIAKVGNFQTNDLPAAKNQITTKSGEIKGKISAYEGQLSQLEANNTNGQNTTKINQLKEEINKLKEQQEQLKKAEASIEELNSRCESAKSDLENKKAEVQDLKKFEDNIKNKKYNLAKSQDKELKGLLDKLKKLDEQIKKASVDKNGNEYSNKDDKRNDKLNRLISERGGLFTSMSSLIKSLSAAGGNGTQFKNSKNQTYQIQNLSAAMDYKPVEVAQS